MPRNLKIYIKWANSRGKKLPKTDTKAIERRESVIDKGLISPIYKEYLEINKRKTNKPVEA